MDGTTGTAKMAGRAGSLLCTVGVILFFIGIFGGPRALVFAGLALMAASLVGFFVQEHIHRRIEYSAK